MLDDVSHWWRAGWMSRISVVTVGGCIAILGPWLAYDASQSGPRWERYKVAHHCVMRYKPGELGAEPSGFEGWICDGRLILKVPTYVGVGGQI